VKKYAPNAPKSARNDARSVGIALRIAATLVLARTLYRCMHPATFKFKDHKELERIISAIACQNECKALKE
jgi:hypothetical protein